MKILVYLFIVLSVINAKNHALVIGLNNKALKGAVNDASAMVKLLENYEIEKPIFLYNEHATKNNILKHLKTIVSSLDKDDRFYFFFSGHGTSLHDPSFSDKIENNNELKELLKDSGSLIPWDFDERDMINSIISAKRDLAPFFREIDKKSAFAMVMIDACFSGSSYKTMRFSNSLPIAIEPHFGEKKYPYTNIVYLASTSVSDWAVEDRSKKPYRSYFSRALEQCLYKHKTVQDVKGCLEISNMPQSAVIYPSKKDFYLFDTDD